MGTIAIDGNKISIIDFIGENIKKVVKKRREEPSRVDRNKEQPGFFYSENDFQISLIREFEKDNNYEVYYEKKKIDIVLESKGIEYPIELKYSYDIYGTGVYSILADGLGEDINFIKELLNDNSKNMVYGYCVILSKKTNNTFNNKEYINKIQPKADFDFINHKLNGILTWKGIELKIQESLPIKYETIENFHYLIVEISKQN